MIPKAEMLEKLAEQMRESSLEWWWLSFADAALPKGSQLLGVAIVQGYGLGHAVMEAHRLGINPGGEVQGIAIPPEHVPEASFRERLLSRDEAESLP